MLGPLPAPNIDIPKVSSHGEAFEKTIEGLRNQDALASAATEDYEHWLTTNFPHVASKPLVERHHRVWRWCESIELGKSPAYPIGEAWGRGGSKSTTVELVVARLGQKLTRKYALLVSATQDQADKHVQSIATLVERLGFLRSMGKFGNPKGWRRNQLQASNGFSIEGIGLDVAARGIKIDENRPDLIIFDDVDELEDTPAIVAKKKQLITRGILPAGSPDLAVMFMQNLIHENSIMNQVVEGTADFLVDIVTHVEKAVDGLKTESYRAENGANRYRVLEGTATWSGQDLETVERQINLWGLTSFLQEAQHNIHGAKGYFFDDTQLTDNIVDEIPIMKRVVRAWDFAATQGGGDYTVAALVGITENGVIWILDVIRVQLSSDNIKILMKRVNVWDRKNFGTKYQQVIPQDPGAAGKRIAREDQQRYGGQIENTSGSKAVRAKKLQEKINSGNVRMLRDGHSREPRIDQFLEEMVKGTAQEGRSHLWNRDYSVEHRNFRADEKHEFDDQVDAGATAVNTLESPIYGYVDRSTQYEEGPVEDGGDAPPEAEPEALWPDEPVSDVEFTSMGWD